MLLDQTHTLDQDAILLRQDLKNLTPRTAEVPRDNLDVVAFPHMMLDPVHKISVTQASSLFRRAGFQPAVRNRAGKMPVRPDNQDGCVTKVIRFITLPEQARRSS